MSTTAEISPAAPSTDELGPIRPAERIAELDILRGFALLGIVACERLGGNLGQLQPLVRWRPPNRRSAISFMKRYPQPENTGRFASFFLSNGRR
jgi:hypothetical protein